jgi:hypothetical protein
MNVKEIKASDTKFYTEPRLGDHGTNTLSRALLLGDLKTGIWAKKVLFHLCKVKKKKKTKKTKKTGL